MINIKKLNIGNKPLFIILLALIILLYYGVFKWLLSSWLNLESYTHGFLIPIIILFLVWRKKECLLEDKGRKKPVILILSLIIYLIGQLIGAVYLVALSLIPFLIGVIQFMRGGEQAKKITPPILFLLLAIPPPNLYDITLTLQLISTMLSSHLAQLMGVSCSYKGCEIILTSTVFRIAPTCSGFNSIISFYTAVTLLVYLIRDPIIDKMILLVSALPIALFTNGLRITATILVAVNCGVDEGVRFFHDWGGILFYLIALTLIFLLLGGIRWMRKINTRY